MSLALHIPSFNFKTFYSVDIYIHTFLFIYFFLRDFIFKKTLFEKLQYLKQEQ